MEYCISYGAIRDYFVILVFCQGAMESARFIVGSEDAYARKCQDSQPDGEFPLFLSF